MNFKDRLKQIRNDYGFTQEEMANFCGVGKSSIQRYEKGLSMPSMEVLKIFINDGYNMHWLFTGKGHPQKKFEANEPRFDFLHDLSQWLSIRSKFDHEEIIWFKKELERSFPEFLEWKKQQAQSKK